jgi:serine/threonine protein kinase
MIKGRKISEQCGTPAYIAPEILKDAGYEGFAVDVWSAGGIIITESFYMPCSMELYRLKQTT